MVPKESTALVELNPRAEVPFVEDSIDAHSQHLEELEKIQAEIDANNDYIYEEPYGSQFDDPFFLPDLESTTLWDDDLVHTPKPPDASVKSWAEKKTGLIGKLKAALGKLAVGASTSKMTAKFGVTKLPPESSTMHDIAKVKTDNEDASFNKYEWIGRHITVSSETKLSEWDGTVLPEVYQGPVMNYLLDWAKAEADSSLSIDESTQQERVEHILRILKDVCGETLGEGTLSEALIAQHQEPFVYGHAKYFPDVKLDDQWVHKMLDTENYSTLVQYLSKADESVNAQDVVDLMIEKDLGKYLVSFMSELPPDVHVPSEVILKAIPENPYFYLNLVQRGELDQLDSNEVFKVIADHVPNMTREAFLSIPSLHLSLDAIQPYLDRGVISIDAILSRKSHIVGLEDIDSLTEFLRKFPSELKSFDEFRSYDRDTQTAVFRVLTQSLGYMSGGMLVSFDNLGEEEYLSILDQYQDNLWNKALGGIEAARGVMRIFDGATGQAKFRYEQELGSRLEARVKELRDKTEMVEEGNRNRQAQRIAELTYFDANNISIDLLESDAHPSDAEICAQFERDHCVKRAPRIKEQMRDTSRDNKIRYLNKAYLKKRFQPEYLSITEHKALMKYDEWLSEAAEAHEQRGEFARSLSDNLTFIGEKEYQEATRAIAVYWKHILDTNEDMQLYVLKGAISEAYYVKSDEYMLDHIVAHFSDEELMRYKGRLILRDKDIVNDSPEHLRVVLLDDWTISGSQLRYAASAFIEAHPKSSACMEIELIAASKERIALGLEEVQGARTGHRREEDISIPVKSYYMAHHAPLMANDTSKGVHITGAHSSVDFGFEYTLNEIINYNDMVQLPPIAKIERPYRKDGYTTVHTKRLLSLYGLGEKNGEVDE